MSAELPPLMPPKKPGGHLTLVTDGQLPVVATANRHPLRALNNFAKRAEDLAQHVRSMNKTFRGLHLVTQHPGIADAKKYLDEASWVLGQYDDEFRELAMQLKLDSETFNPADAYDDHGNITEHHVRKHIALLLGSLPNSKPGNPAVYSGMMIEEVMAQDGISLAALESACSDIRRTLKFAPSIAEVIDAIVDQDNLWSPRWSAIDDCAGLSEELRDDLKIATELVVAEKAKREQQRLAYEEEKRVETERLRAAHVAVGDRVRHITAGGIGTVVGDDVPGRANYCSVRSDQSGRLIDVDRQYLEKLALT
jgi:hypothetical protein